MNAGDKQFVEEGSVDADLGLQEQEQRELTEAAEVREANERMAAARARERAEQQGRLAAQAEQRLRAEEAALFAAQEHAAAQERIARESAARLAAERAALEAANSRAEAERRALAVTQAAEHDAGEAALAAAERVDAEDRAQALTARRLAVEAARKRAAGARRTRVIVAVLALLTAFALGLLVSSYWGARSHDADGAVSATDLKLDTRWEKFGETRGPRRR